MIYFLLALAVIAVLIVGIYNSLVKLKNKAEQAWSDIDTQLKKRYDLVPNLVETVKGYAKHESQTFENVVKARSAAMGAQNFKEKAEAENMLTGALKSIFALAENYPDLKANQNFLELQKTLTDIENAIQPARATYNDAVRALNTKMEVFPNNLIAGPFGFKKREFFEIKEEERENPKVSFTEPPTSQIPPA
ncbi:MAG: LemA family protein [Nitrospirota bacterium]